MKMMFRMTPTNTKKSYRDRGNNLWELISLLILLITLLLPAEAHEASSIDIIQEIAGSFF